MRDALLLAWIAFAFLLLGASPAHAWLDAGEIASAGAALGVMHPPGVPGLTHLLRLTAIVPLGTMGFRMAALSAAMGAATVVVIWMILRRHRVHPGLRWACCLWILASLTFVRNSRLVEVYGMATLLLSLVLWAFDPRVPRARRDRMRLLGVFFASVAVWGFGDLRLALVPWLGWVFVADLRRGRVWARWAPLVAVAGTAVVLGLPLSSARAPLADWGDPDTLGRLWSHLQADAIRDSFRDEILPASASLWAVHARGALDRISEDLGPLGLVLAVGAGLTLLLGRGRPRRWTLAAAVVWIAAVELFYAVGINPMGGPDRQTGMVFAPLAALAVGLGAHGWTRQRPHLRWGLSPLLGAALIVPASLASWADAAETRSWGPHVWTRAALGQLPPGALLLTQSDDLAAGSLYARVHEGARPDLVVIPAQHLYRPPPDAVLARPPWARVWGPAHGRATEADRILAAISAHPDAVALELPRSTIFSGVPWWNDGGDLPLGVDGPAPARREPADAVARWLPRLPAPADRLRLAVALSSRARALLRVRGAQGVLAAQRLLEISLRDVRSDHPAGLVAAGAVLDRRGETAAAVELTRRALELEPDREAALTNLALYLSRDSRTRAEGLALARRAASLRPWHPGPWARVAEIATLSGDTAVAQHAQEQLERLRVARKDRPSWSP